MIPRNRFSLGILIAGFIGLLTVNPLWPQSYSQARIVRLSFVEGNVTVQRPDIPAWAEAPVNTPLQQGFKLSTGENSYAEVQFENGGTIRLGEFGLLEFTRLELTPEGEKINHVDLRQGYATFHPLPSRVGESFRVGTTYGTLVAQGGTEFRVDLDQGIERVEVIDGSVEVQRDLGAMTLDRDSVLVMQPGSSQPTAISQGITQDDWDQWVNDRENQIASEAAGPSPDGYTGDDAEGAYGWTDLLQYGNWSNVPGAGYGWMPYGVDAGWAPYSMGQWCWYPGWGYTWIAAEPWGWLPYHYGGWRSIPGKGWIWFPGSLRRWSPAKVTWFHGPGWVGWTPRTRGKDNGVACESNCGGGVVSASAFRHGGVLTPNLMLAINPTTGEMVREPGIVPSIAAKLPGPAVPRPAALSHGSRVIPAGGAAGAGNPSVVMASPGLRNGSAAPPNSTIVYDPQQDSYINGHRATTPQPSPAPRVGASAFTPPVSSPGLIQSAPVGNGEMSGQPAENPAFGRPRSAPGAGPIGSVPPMRGYAYAAPSSSSSPSAKQGPSVPNSSVSGGRTGGSQAGESHVNVGTSSGGHSSPAPSGGGHSGGGSVGGGHH
ncbi:MAG: DUF6600 domain-containing protein [Terriglobia bacterium]